MLFFGPFSSLFFYLSFSHLSLSISTKNTQPTIQGTYDGKINFIELMVSRRWLEANSKRAKELQQEQQGRQQQQRGKTLCWDVLGSPSAWPTAGYRPHRYCFEPGKEKNTSRIRWSEFLYFDKSPECEQVSPTSPSKTIFAPKSFAPPQQEAEKLNPLCKHDKRSTIAVLAVYTASLVQGKKHREAVAAAVEAKVLLAGRAREGAESSREFLAAVKDDEGVSQTNDEPVRWAEQLHAVGEAVGHAMG